MSEENKYVRSWLQYFLLKRFFLRDCLNPTIREMVILNIKKGTAIYLYAVLYSIISMQLPGTGAINF